MLPIYHELMRNVHHKLFFTVLERHWTWFVCIEDSWCNGHFLTVLDKDDVPLLWSGSLEEL